MANKDIGFISKQDFMRLLPDRVPVRKSAKEGAKFPLYCHAPLLGPVSINTRGGQEIILENAQLFSPDNPGLEPEKIPEPELIPGDPGDPGEPGEPKSHENSGFIRLIDTLGTFDE